MLAGKISKLTKHLYLELPHQQIAVLFEVETETATFMKGYLKQDKREPRKIISSDGAQQLQAFTVKEWEPETYPGRF
jgi:hypothetical protein